MADGSQFVPLSSSVEEDRLRRRLGADLGELRLDVVRDECSWKVKVVLEELVRLILVGQRDECLPKRMEQRREVLRLVGQEARDECAQAGPSP